MSIENASINLDGVIGVTGGTADSLNSLGGDRSSKRVYFNGTDIRTRSSAEFTVQEPKSKADAPNGYTQARRKVKGLVPMTLTNGLVTSNGFEISLHADVEAGTTEIEHLRSLIAQFATDSDFDGFWEGLSVE